MTWYGTLSLVYLPEGTIDNFYQLISGKNANKKQNRSQHQVSKHDLLSLLRRKTQQCWYYLPTNQLQIYTHRYIHIYIYIKYKNNYLSLIWPFSAYLLVHCLPWNPAFLFSKGSRKSHVVDHLYPTISHLHSHKRAKLAQSV